jgi:PAS domain S-box-containing protein
MELETLGEWKLPHFDLASLRVEGYVLLGLYIVLSLLILYLRRGDFRVLRGRKAGLFLALLLFTVPLNNLLWLRFPTTSILPPPGVADWAPAPSAPLLGSLSIALAGALFGAGPAMILGLMAGLVRGGMDSSRVFVPLELAAFGVIVGFLLRQDYRGLSGRLIRQPLVAGLVGVGCRWVLLFLDIYAATDANGLSALDYTQSLLIASLGAVLLDGFIGVLIVQGLYPIVSGLKPSTTAALTPPHLRSMNRRLLTALIPLTLAMILAMFYAVTRAAVKEATNQVLNTMVRDASNASEVIPLFFNTGQELLKQFSSEEQLRSSDAEVRRKALESDLKVGVYGPFFSQLILFDQKENPINHYPADDPPPVLSLEETMLLTRTLQFGSPERSHVFVTEDGEHLMSFIAPLEDADRKPQGALVGRTRLSENPMIANLLSSLKGPEGADSGFIVDERGLIAFHPDKEHLLDPWSINLDCPDTVEVPEQAGTQVPGKACQDLTPDNKRRLIYYLPVEALGNWTAVIIYPNEMVLDRATRISGPLLLILVAVTGVLAVLVPWVTSRLTRPLQFLSTAARGIAEGQLDNQVTLTGEDEVGQLGRAFESMRLSLKDRLEDLSLLLRVSQAVSSNLDLTRGIPIILEGALQATEARYARLILLDERGEPQIVMAGGEDGGYVTALDRAMARLGRAGRPVTIENVARAKSLIEPGLANPDTQALIAVPVRSKDHDVGVMWLGYDRVHQFGATEIDFLSTLASQAAVAVDNARLFQAAEGGRRRLAAILESTSDVVIVTDHADRVLLFNRAAAEAFGTDFQAVSGLPIAEVIQQQKVIRLLTAELDDDVPLTDEVPLPDGRTLYASASVISSGDGQTIGRVAVLRDITYLKELDEMKSKFVETVSHDLRSPLTFMRGYITMIPMVGDVSAKQKLYVDKIMIGIEQMTELIEDLLDLGRIEAGVGLMREPCRLDEIIVALVNSTRPQAVAKRLTLRLDRTEDVTVVVGDAALLRRAISNLVENAIKYTPEGGSVTVGWETRGDRVLINVADTGIGIAKADQVRMFEKFYRIRRRDRPDTVKIKGSGLGLAIVKSIVEWHNGRVRVESELDQGSTFYIELPVGEP